MTVPVSSRASRNKLLPAFPPVSAEPSEKYSRHRSLVVAATMTICAGATFERSVRNAADPGVGEIVRFEPAIVTLVANVYGPVPGNVPEPTSAAVIVPHAGAFGAVPVPVLVRNCLTDVVGPGNRLSAPEGNPCKRSPGPYVVNPVPPYAVATGVPFHTPDAIVPSVVIEGCPT